MRARNRWLSRIFVALLVVAGIAGGARAGEFGPTAGPARVANGSTYHYGGYKIEYRNLGRDGVLNAVADGTSNYPGAKTQTVPRAIYTSSRGPAIYVAGPGTPLGNIVDKVRVTADGALGYSCRGRGQTLAAAIIDITEEFGYEHITVSAFSRGNVTANEALHRLASDGFRGRVKAGVFFDPVFSVGGPRLNLGVHTNLPTGLPIDKALVIIAGGENRFSFPLTRFTHPNLEELLIPNAAHAQVGGGYRGLMFPTVEAAEAAMETLEAAGGRFRYRIIHLDPAQLTDERFWPSIGGARLVTPRANIDPAIPVVDRSGPRNAKVFDGIRIDSLYETTTPEEALKAIPPRARLEFENPRINAAVTRVAESMPGRIMKKTGSALGAVARSTPGRVAGGFAGGVVIDVAAEEATGRVFGRPPENPLLDTKVGYGWFKFNMFDFIPFRRTLSNIGWGLSTPWHRPERNYDPDLVDPYNSGL